MAMQPCKHLDHTGDYSPHCTLQTLHDFTPPVKYWQRDPKVYDENLRVQFCGQGRGRINGIFQCYNAGEMPCYKVDG